MTRFSGPGIAPEPLPETGVVYLPALSYLVHHECAIAAELQAIQGESVTN